MPQIWKVESNRTALAVLSYNRIGCRTETFCRIEWQQECILKMYLGQDDVLKKYCQLNVQGLITKSQPQEKVELFLRNRSFRGWTIRDISSELLDCWLSDSMTAMSSVEVLLSKNALTVDCVEDGICWSSFATSSVEVPWSTIVLLNFDGGMVEPSDSGFKQFSVAIFVMMVVNNSLTLLLSISDNESRFIFLKWSRVFPTFHAKRRINPNNSYISC